MVDLVHAALVFGIVGAAIVIISLVRSRPLGHVATVAMRSKKLWNRAELLVLLLILVVFAVLFVVNNWLKPATS